MSAIRNLMASENQKRTTRGGTRSNAVTGDQAPPSAGHWLKGATSPGAEHELFKNVVTSKPSPAPGWRGSILVHIISGFCCSILYRAEPRTVSTHAQCLLRGLAGGPRALVAEAQS